MLKKIQNRLRRFRRDEEGTIIAETVIMFPTLFAAVLATFVFFDAFRNQSINVKAAYTISDYLSREEDFVTNQYMTNMWKLHRFLTNSAYFTKLRVSVIQYVVEEDEDWEDGRYRVSWSREKGGAGELTNGGLNQLVNANKIPVMPANETVILVQTWVDYEPDFSIGLGGFTFENLIVTRPRFGPMLCYSHNGTNGGRVCPLDS